MPNITDLTGCTWVGNDVLSADVKIVNYYKNSPQEGYNLIFDSYSWSWGENTFDYLYIDSSGIPEEDTVYDIYDKWGSETRSKTMQILGGNDATNPELIAWLQANGTLTSPTPVIEGIQGQIDRITNNISDSYDAVEEKGGTMPASLTSDNLANAIMSIPAGQVDDVTVNGTSVVTNKIAAINVKTVNNQSIIGSGNLNIIGSTIGYEELEVTNNG